MPISNSTPLVLDTHIWIWLFEGHNKLDNRNLRKTIDAAAINGHIHIPSIALWELSMLEEKGRITLAMEIHTWINRALSFPGHNLAPMTPEIAIDSSRLPGDFHGDPADRIITATARELNAVLVTADQEIIRYGKTRHLRVLPV